MRDVSVMMVMLTAVVAAVLVSAEEPARLGRLHRLSVAVEITHPLPSLAAGDLGVRVASALRGADPPLTIDPGVSDRLRVGVTVRPVSATTLRGFWLPFSGTYGIGAVRLAVERVMSPATVWQAERVVGVTWRETDREVVRLVDEMLKELVEARRAAVR